jgi:hypothetical protein
MGGATAGSHDVTSEAGAGAHMPRPPEASPRRIRPSGESEYLRFASTSRPAIQPAESFVPLSGDVMEPAPRLTQSRRVDLPNVIASHSGTAHQARPRENVWVLSDGLACDTRALRQPHDRHRASRAEPGHDAEACGIADSLERPEDLARCRARARSADRSPRGRATTPGCGGVPTTRKQTSRRRGSGDAI